MNYADDHSVDVVFVGDDPELADMYMLKLQLEGYAVTALTTEQARTEPGRMRAADILYLDIGSFDASGVAMHQTLRKRRDTKNLPIVVLATRRARETVSTALHLTVRDFVISSDTAGAERFAAVSQA